MKNTKKTIISLLLLATGIFGCKKTESVVSPDNGTNPAVVAESFKSGDPIPGKYIVVYNKNYATNLKSQFKRTMSFYEKEQFMSAQNISFASKFSIPANAIQFNYHSSIAGFSASLSYQELAALRSNPDVAYVEQDRMISLGKPSSGGGGSAPSKTTPTGISRVGGGNGGASTGHIAWIIDTGIDSLHPDIKTHCGIIGGVWKGISYITSGSNPHSSFDQNGHGTHVSGTISGIGTGVYGVVPGNEVVPVRVLDASGSGSISGVIKGVDYVGANASAGDVANMSLGGSFYQALNDAVVAASSNGVFFAIAAGNSSTSYLTSSPASAAGNYIFTVTAMSTSANGTGWNDTWASFSNYGDPQTGGNIIFCEPGVDVLSDYAGTIKGGRYSGGNYATLSGTSMATPHLAGILLAKGSVSSSGYVSGDPDGSSDPVGHE